MKLPGDDREFAFLENFAANTSEIFIEEAPTANLEAENYSEESIAAYCLRCLSFR